MIDAGKLILRGVMPVARTTSSKSFRASASTRTREPLFYLGQFQLGQK